MPWDDRQNKGNGSKWGRRGSSPEELFRRFAESIKSKGPSPLWILLILVVIWLLTSSLYKVDVEEVGVIQFFGRYVRTTEPGLHLKLPAGIEKLTGRYVRTTEPGLHLKLPAGIEKLTKVPVRKVLSEEFGLRTVRAGIRTQYAPARQYDKESLMLTGDLNVGIVPWIVQYRILDPYRFLFKVRNVQETLRDLSEAIVRQVVGDRSINEVLNRRAVIADAAKVALQKALDEAETGIRLANLELKTTNVPDPVQPAFNDVNKATQDKQKMIRAAEEQFNREIPAARGAGRKMVQEALGYQIDRVNRAKGDASRFLALWKEYREAPEVTRRRLYLETMAEVLPKVGHKYILDEDQRGILPLLDLSPKGGTP
jgi:membrane protease subunit HflK